MKERDYINATDLAKARIARQVLGDLILATEAERQWRDDVTRKLCRLIESLDKRVKEK